MSYIESFLTSLVTSGMVTAAILWTVRLWLTERLKQSIQHEYGVLLESHKATLKAEMDLKVAGYQAKLASENAQSLERLRADLQIAASQRQLQQKHLHEREAEAIAETYENLSELRTKFSDYVSIVESPAMGSKAERREAFSVALTKFRTRFRLHRLYLPRALADSVASFQRELFRLAHTFALRIEPDQRDRDTTELWIKIDEFMEKEAPVLFDQLENQFRRRLGQEVPTTSPLDTSATTKEPG